MNRKNMEERSRQIPRGVFALGMVSLFMDMSSELIHSLLPALFMSVFNVNMSTIGVIEGLAEATASITKIFSGALSDWLGKRKILAVIGYGLGAISKPLFPLAPNVMTVFFARFVDRIGKGIRGAPRDALIADLTPKEIRGAAYGLRQSLDSLGAFLGPFIAIYLMYIFSNNVKTVLWFSVIPAFFCVMILVFGVREPKVMSQQKSKVKFPIQKSEIKRLSKSFWILSLTGAMFSLSRFSEIFMTFKSIEVGLSLMYTPLVLAIMSISYSLSSYPAGKLADKINRKILLIIGLVVLIISDILLAKASNLTVVFLGVSTWGLHMGLTQGLLSTMVADVAPTSLRGTAFGIFNLVNGVVLLVASSLAGILWDNFGSEMTFLAGSVFAVATILLITLGSEHKSIN